MRDTPNKGTCWLYIMDEWVLIVGVVGRSFSYHFIDKQSHFLQGRRVLSWGLTGQHSGRYTEERQKIHKL